MMREDPTMEDLQQRLEAAVGVGRRLVEENANLAQENERLRTQITDMAAEAFRQQVCDVYMM